MMQKKAESKNVSNGTRRKKTREKKANGNGGEAAYRADGHQGLRGEPRAFALGGNIDVPSQALALVGVGVAMPAVGIARRVAKARVVGRADRVEEGVHVRPVVRRRR